MHSSGVELRYPPARLESVPYELVHVTCVFRHGARAPIYNVDQDGVNEVQWGLCDASAQMSIMIENENDDLIKLVQHDDRAKPPQPSLVDASQRAKQLNGGCRSGELTAQGYTQAERLGEKIRSLYGSVDAACLEARTTHVARCVLSLRGVLSTLLEKKHLIPVATCHASEEWLTPSVRSCSRLAELWSILKKKNAQAMRITLDPLAQLMPIDVRKTYNMPDTAIPLKDVLVARRGNDIPLPWGLDDDFVAKIDHAAAAEVANLVGKNFSQGNLSELELIRLAAGRLLHDIHTHLLAVTSKTHHSKTTIRLISGHDTTVLPLLVSLGIYDQLWPPFCACCTIELYKNKHGAFFVRLCYNGATANHVADEAGHFYVAKSLEPLSDFSDRLAQLALTREEYDAACSMTSSSDQTAAVEGTSTPAPDENHTATIKRKDEKAADTF